jgi:hypothetical protein
VIYVLNRGLPRRAEALLATRHALRLALAMRGLPRSFTLARNDIFSGHCEAGGRSNLVVCKIASRPGCASRSQCADCHARLHSLAMTFFQVIARPEAEAIWLCARLLPVPAAPGGRNVRIATLVYTRSQ